LESKPAQQRESTRKMDVNGDVHGVPHPTVFGLIIARYHWVGNEVRSIPQRMSPISLAQYLIHTCIFLLYGELNKPRLDKRTFINDNPKYHDTDKLFGVCCSLTCRTAAYTRMISTTIGQLRLCAIVISDV